MSGKSALIAGATGLTGSKLVEVLLDRPEYDKITVFVRRPLTLEHPKLEQIHVDYYRLDDYKKHFQVDDVFCCLGTTIKKAGSQKAFRRVDYDYPVALAQLAKSAGAKNFLVVSAMGADSRSNIFYNRVKGQMEDSLKKMELPALHIFRPSLLLGDRKEFRLGEKVASLISPVFSPLLRGGMKKYKPIQAEQVAKAMCTAAQTESGGIQVYPSDRIAEMGSL
ncbi:oxidoreductase [Planococcus halotolerans]|uniref:Oxidoreductase n=1 Tax=Planococcus halotolerans TaxID=2233542 RepID=A0A365L6E3_9BACL|nr:oxidoreductase [Planococcus halotolerans]QHJ70292.1 NAD(P)H-binding protein [Planococcus halotolerans]RAZ80978.1 oxidoreductase [Planococcus halotolerans]